MAQESFQFIKKTRRKKGLIVIKINMEKAFDFMEWEFLLGILNCLGFHEKWFNWIRTCITSASFSVLINGEPCGYIQPNKPLR